jgi:hypothetical protein
MFCAALTTAADSAYGSERKLGKVGEDDIQRVLGLFALCAYRDLPYRRRSDLENTHQRKRNACDRRREG